MASSFRSGVELNFWQQWIYDSIDIQPPPRINHISVTFQNEENSQANNGRRSICSVGGLVEQLVSLSKCQKAGLVSKIVEILGMLVTISFVVNWNSNQLFKAVSVLNI
ncbi:uncharacterized protein LOC108866907 [Pyrus x bretschneideri]|uniref:uncharacterized protein LOC108866907 n=1 Tax=Pyrus x bretschneideri TaxID=225117 RepID=UPI00202DCC51|nr:uncharacterized protein LOC108866907 [Pyrus x bretschneideri]